MHSKKTLTLAALLLPSLLALADDTDKLWDQRYQELCKYESMCYHIKENNEFRKPVPEMLQAFASLRPTILKYSRQFGVDPRAVAGAILAENSLNSNVIDSVKNLLTRMKITPNGQILGKSRSIGWGLIHADTAESAERYVAKLENRQPKDMTDIGQQLMSPEGSIYYAAAIIREGQDAYIAAGFKKEEIANHPEILATLYNIGNYKQHAEQAKRENRLPKPNYFGFWVWRFQDAIEQATGTANQTLVAEGAKAAPAAAPAHAASATTPTVTVAKPVVPQVAAIKIKHDLTLANVPPVCTNTNTRKDSIGKFAPGTIVQAVGTTVDCNLKTWTLLRTASGETGWVSNELLTANSEKTTVPKTCLTGPNASCEADVKKLADERYSGRQDDGRDQVMKIFGKGAQDCHTVNVTSKGTPLTQLELYEMYKAYKKFQEKLASAPYDVQQAVSVLSFDDFNHTLDSCMRIPCVGDKDRFLKALEMPLTSPVKGKDVEKLLQGAQLQVSSDSAVRDPLKAKLKTCSTLVKGRPKSEDYLKKILATIDYMPTSSALFGKEASRLGDLERTCKLLVDREVEIAQENQGAKRLCQACQQPAKPACQAIPNPPPNGYYVAADGSAIQYQNGQPVNAYRPGQLQVSTGSGGTRFGITYNGRVVTFYPYPPNYYGSTPAPSPSPSPAINDDAYFCSDTSILARFGATQAYGQNQQQYGDGSPFYVLKAFEDAQDKDTEVVNMMANTVPSQFLVEKPEDDCQFNLGLARDVIEAISKNSCVKNIFVSDLYMFDYVNDDGVVPVVYRPSSDPSDVFVELKTGSNCSGGSSK